MHYFNIAVNCSQRITICSTGGAANKTYLKDKLGSYNLIHYDDALNPVYEHGLKNGIFLYQTEAGVNSWMVGQILEYTYHLLSNENAYCLFLKDTLIKEKA